MDGSIRLSEAERKTVLGIYRGGPDVCRARRAHILLLLERGYSYRQIMGINFCSSDLIRSVKHGFLAGGWEAALTEPHEERPTIPYWQVVVAGWLLERTPRDFGYFRSRWSCELLADLLREQHQIRLSGESVRRGLHALGFAWRRPRPIVGLTDPDHDWKMRRLRRLLNHLPAEEVAVFQDEVDVHLNPKIGACWMPKGQQTTVETPGNNAKQHLAGSLVWQTGTLLVSRPGTRRNAALFLAHLDDLRRRLRGFRKIHVLCDNAAFHRCRAVHEYLTQWGHRIELHFLPAYAPQTNPIERVWWHLHETITRNHRCRTLNELLAQAYEWIETNNNHYLEMRRCFATAA
jgi:putative transposase